MRFPSGHRSGAMARTKESQKAAGVLTRPVLKLVQKAQREERAAAKKKAAEAKKKAAEAKAKKKALHEHPRNPKKCSELFKRSR